MRNKGFVNSFYKDKVVLVTGGTGFVGTHIVQELLKHGAKIRVPLHRRPLMIQDERIETIQADLTRKEECFGVFKGVDYVFHAAGAVGSAGVMKNVADTFAGITTNLILTTQVLHAALAENVERILLLSSSTVYPVTDHPVREEEAWSGPTHPSYFGYGWMKRYLEKMAEFISANSSIKIALIRPTAVYGRWDNFDLSSGHVIPALVRKAVERKDPYEVWGSGKEIRDFLHVTDVARASLLLLEKYATGDPVNVGYGKVVEIKDIVRIILKAAGHERAQVIFNASKPTTIPVRMVDTSKAKRILGFEPQINLEEGLEDAVNWYRKYTEH